MQQLGQSSRAERSYHNYRSSFSVLMPASGACLQAHLNESVNTILPGVFKDETLLLVAFAMSWGPPLGSMPCQPTVHQQRWWHVTLLHERSEQILHMLAGAVFLLTITCVTASAATDRQVRQLVNIMI